ncbi:unnamed protein product [Dibothriocephalus latus]|uniref:Uncharacterized protein n=1 Tax=Dibothriocephalus latus TaxID=60516 RepID=A0A3P7LNN0_DIBLA|nr:unnamed protein product [Dibothriocephalus latus]
MTRLVFPLHPSELFSMFRTALSSLTRLGVCNYFLLIGHLVHSICTVGPSSQTASTLNELVQFVSSLFSLRGELSTTSDDAETTWWLDWEIGRRCAAMEGLQLLLLLILKTARDLPSLAQATRKLVDLSTRFRRALITCMQMSVNGRQAKMQGLTQSASSSKLTGLGWRNELISRSVDFCECLLWPSDPGWMANTDSVLAYLDSSVLEVVLSADTPASTSFFLRLLEEPSSSGDLALDPRKAFVWNKLYPKLIEVSSSLPATADPDDGAGESLSLDYAEMAVLLTSSPMLR